MFQCATCPGPSRSRKEPTKKLQTETRLNPSPTPANARPHSQAPVPVRQKAKHVPVRHVSGAVSLEDRANKKITNRGKVEPKPNSCERSAPFSGAGPCDAKSKTCSSAPRVRGRLARGERQAHDPAPASLLQSCRTKKTYRRNASPAGCEMHGDGVGVGVGGLHGLSGAMEGHHGFGQE
jgi:hypothetical protein